MSDVFVSHSSKDKEIADKLVEFLEGRGLSCWIAPRDIVPGSEWAASITTAITASKVCLLIFSENSAASSQVARELSLAESKNNVFVVPYRIDHVELSGTFEYYLTSAHWITADYAKKDYKLEELYHLIAGVTGKSVQNITNITNIDNLHIHTEGDPIAAAGKIGQMPGAAPSPAPAAVSAPQTAGEKSKLPMIIGIAAACLVLVAGGIGAAVALGKRSAQPQDTVEVIETTTEAATESTTEQVTEKTTQKETEKATTKAPAETKATTAAPTEAATVSANASATGQAAAVEAWGYSYDGTYTGEVNADGLPDGEGVFYASWEKDTGSYSMQFEGSFENGVVSGQATSINVCPDYTETIECLFVNSKPNGAGTETEEYEDHTSVYKGGFVDGNWEGKSTSLHITYPESGMEVIYEGDREAGSLVGTVKETVINDPNSMYSKSVYVGQWDATANDFTGIVKKTGTIKQGGSIVQQGEWSNFSFNGEGSYTSTFDPPIGDEKKTVENFEGTMLNGRASQGTLTTKFQDGTSKITRNGSWDAAGNYISGTGTIEKYDASGNLIK